MDLVIIEEDSIIPVDEPDQPHTQTAMVSVRQPFLSFSLPQPFFASDPQSPLRPDLTVSTETFPEQTQEPPPSPSTTETPKEDSPDQTPSCPTITNVMRSLHEVSDMT